MNREKKHITIRSHSRSGNRFACLFMSIALLGVPLVSGMVQSTKAYAAPSASIKRALKTSGYHQKLFVTKPLNTTIRTPLAPPRKPVEKDPGFVYAERGQWSKLSKEIARRGESPLGKILTWLYVKSPDSHAQFKTAQTFLAQNPTWPSRAILIRNAEKALFRTPSASEKARWLANGRANTLEGELWLIENAKRKGQLQKATKRIHRVWGNYPFSTSDEKAFLKAYGKDLKANHHWQRMDTLIWERRFREARRQLKRVKGKYRLLAEARIAFATRSRKASKAYALVPQALRGNSGLVYERARWLRRRGKDPQAAQALLAFQGRRPYPQLWWTETSILIRDAIKAKHYPLSYQLATHMRQNTVGRKADAQWMAGWIALEFLHKPDTAAKHFQTLFETVKTPVSLGRGAYWLARALEKQGKTEAANQWYAKATQYNTTFYGQLASYRIGQHTLLSATTSPIPAQARNWVHGHEFTKVLSVLQRNQEMRLFRIFARAFFNTAQSPEKRRAVVAYIAQISLGQSVHLARVLRQQNIHDLTLTYPVPTWIDFQKKPDKAMVLSLIRQESNFDPEAQSPVGARGLMQIMPSTAKVEAKKMKRPFSTYALTHEPGTNVAIGSHYFQRLLDIYDDHPSLALAAYNAGPRNVNKWIKTYGDPRSEDVDTITWMESIPFKETRNYVQRILENHYIYQWLLQDGSERTSTRKIQKKG